MGLVWTLIQKNQILKKKKIMRLSGNFEHWIFDHIKEFFVSGMIIE